MHTIDDVIAQVKAHAGELRRDSFLKLVHLVKDWRHVTLIETGTIRNAQGVDGCSTQTFAQLAVALESDFYSVDLSADSLRASRDVLGDDARHVQYAQCDSVAFLSCFATPISILYLDSYDYDPATPLPAQVHQVAELGAAYGKLTRDAFVLLDDCNIPGGGKGLLSSQFLTERGWKLIHDQYQKLFVRTANP